jgi:uncharacterized protein (DUF427 family)
MKAMLEGKVIAEGDGVVHAYDIMHEKDYAYFPREHVRIEWLEKAPKSASDLTCPHDVQFYDVIVDGRRHARAAWSYAAPHGDLAHVAGRVGFWKDVEVK